jgi:hypothetical protein
MVEFTLKLQKSEAEATNDGDPVEQIRSRFFAAIPPLQSLNEKLKPFTVLVDTCVWLDLARDYREQPVIAALEDTLSPRQKQCCRRHHHRDLC